MKFVFGLFVALFCAVSFGQDMQPIQGYAPGGNVAVIQQQQGPVNPGGSLPYNTWTGGMTESWTQSHTIYPNQIYPTGTYPTGVPQYTQPVYTPACTPAYGCGYQQPCQRPCQRPCYNQPYYQPRQQSWYPGYYMGY